MNCNICDSSTKNIFQNNVNISISSDSQIIEENLNIYKCDKCGHFQKKATKHLDNIYNKYKNNDLIDGMDQIKFTGEVPSFRTDIILHELIPYIKNKKNILDIGTGTGVFLKSCEKLTNLELNAFDLNERNKEKVLNINNVKAFYSDSIENINNQFDIISLIHVLEHVEKPKDFFERLKLKLNKDGIIIIQVPYILENPNDLLIIDHLSHFKKSTLQKLLKNFFSKVLFINTPIKKELTIVATNEKNFKEERLLEEDIEINPFYINQLNNYLLSQKEPLFIFGTAPISSYYAAILDQKNKLAGFLDEDLLKIKKNYLNTEIEHPKNKENISCFIPLNNDITEQIKLKYKKIKFISIKEVLNNEKL